MEMISLTLRPEYKYVAGLACLISVYCVVIGFCAGARRRSLFSDQFMKMHFGDEHTKYCKGAALPKQGYPDCGSGIYSQKLTYKDWLQFNEDQRAHKAFLEQVTIAVFCVFVSGLIRHEFAIGFGICYLLNRVACTFSHRVYPNAR